MPAFKLTLPVLALVLLPAAAAAGGKYGTTARLTSASTSSVVKLLETGFADCRAQLPKAYRYDCYRSVYRRARQRIRGSEDYAAADQALALVQKTLEQAVAQNADPAKPRIRQGLTRYRAIQVTALPAVKARTDAALQEAETLLLRASGRRQSHYVRIARAVGSNKLLLRTALRFLGWRLGFA
ncbi:hypothetical protein AB838_08690 [Rhodobacteraceae bacterium (ex Bugula neritina AB1)]|nr:hypothetical protein AB838_08690 [Rhodobacteraceae bacterium (ex Bugula neritina AB1)]